MWVSTEAARKAANGTHIAIRIDNLRYNEGSDEKLRVDLMVGSLKMIGMVALPSDLTTFECISILLFIHSIMN